MSWPDVIISVAGIGVLAASIFLVVGRTRRARNEIDLLRKDIAVYAEASIRVADTLDKVLQGKATPSETSHSSRRYLLSEAQRAAAQGESLDAVAARLQLSHDELHLLRYTQGTICFGAAAGAAASAVASAVAGAAAGATADAAPEKRARGRSWAA